MDPFHENEDFERNMADNNCINLNRALQSENEEEMYRETLPTSNDELEEGQIDSSSKTESPNKNKKAIDKCYWGNFTQKE